MNKKPVLLAILDGFGKGNKDDSDAIYHANTPNLDYVFKNCPSTYLEASGVAVGLPENQMGNSEVGHMNIGAGRVVYQDFTYINKCISDGSFFDNPELSSILKYVESKGSSLHLMGLLSDGGVHSHINHLFEILKLSKQYKIKRIYIHAWLDGRDTPPKSSIKYIRLLKNHINNLNNAELATVSGRYYAMDRDKNFNRTQLAYDAIVNSIGQKIGENFETIINQNYENNITDEFIKPVISLNYSGIKNIDAVICFNYRPDRARQITRMIADKNLCKYACFTLYDSSIKNVSVIFKPRKIINTLSEYLSENKFKQLKIAETEKYAHVTFFFNGGIEPAYDGEDRIIIDSPKVATYDLQPEMSAKKITEKVIEKIRSKNYDLIVLNYANPDMVGHTGNFAATVKAVETVDECIGKLLFEMEKIQGVTIITADHGNAEKMFDESGNPCTSHTTNLVPFAVVGYAGTLKNKGALCDIAPTVLEILNAKKPREMTGQSLLKN
ncbi:MAG: 2,3-bisphosphoglycerate-independent phosphoglycerate mutase [Acutalibacteraceae bacterium]